MKKVLIFIVISFLIPSAILHVLAKENHQEKQHIHDSGKKLRLKLNNGKKWKADQVAIQGVNNMFTLVKLNNGKKLTVKEYKALSIRLLNETNNILNNCTMKGQGHEELHKLLLKVIEEIKVLKGNDPIKSQLAINRLKINLADFSTYFEYY